MKKFYICKLCLIVFGVLLALQSAVASEEIKTIAPDILDKWEREVEESKKADRAAEDRVLQKGIFRCTNVVTTYLEFVEGRVQRGTDTAQAGTPLTITYSEIERPLEKKKGWDDSYIDLLVEGHSISDRLYTGLLSSEYQGIYFSSDGEVFKAARVGGFYVTLKRVYKEDWSGFFTKHFGFGEGSSFTSSLRCKRDLVKGL